MDLLLAVDTSGKNGSLALAQGYTAQSQLNVLEVLPLAGGAFSAQLVPQVAALLQRHGCIKNELTAFAVATGPGSFTGLRVGLAAIVAFADALQKPIVAISTLEAVACSGSHRGRVLAVLDAGRGDVYVGDYQLGPGVLIHSESLLKKGEFISMTKSVATPFHVVTPDALLAGDFQTAGIPLEKIDPPDSAAIARLGWQHLQDGQILRPDQLEANYIRRSDAEIFSKPAS